MLYLANAFSLAMLKLDEPIQIVVRPVTLEYVKEKVVNGFVSAIGHESTASILSKLLSTDVPMNRISIKVQKGDVVIVFQLKERLPEGKVLSEEEIENLMKEGKIEFVEVTI